MTARIRTHISEVKPGPGTITLYGDGFDPPIQSMEFSFRFDKTLGEIQMPVEPPPSDAVWRMSRAPTSDPQGPFHDFKLSWRGEDMTQFVYPIDVNFAAVASSRSGGIRIQSDVVTDPWQEVDTSGIKGVTLTPLVVSTPSPPQIPKPALAERILSLPKLVTVKQGSKFRTPLTVNDAEDVRGITIYVKYPEQVIEGVTFQKRGLFRGWDVRFNDQIKFGVQKGIIYVAMSTNQSMADGLQQVGDFYWSVRDDATLGEHTLDLEHTSARDFEYGIHYSQTDCKMVVVAKVAVTSTSPFEEEEVPDALPEVVPPLEINKVVRSADQAEVEEDEEAYEELRAHMKADSRRQDGRINRVMKMVRKVQRDFREFVEERGEEEE